jgi:DNA-binding PadR family transcriptional regulator
VADRLNATQGSLLGFLHDGPKTGWELLQAVETGLSRFWNITPSHVYRELHTLRERQLVTAGERGTRDRQPFAITPAGRRAFKRWIEREPGPEQIRFPLLVTLWFGGHLDDEALSAMLAASEAEHEERLRLYKGIAASDRYVEAVVSFGIAYETAILEWLRTLPKQLRLPNRMRSDR